jgi:alanine dehydrogenase
MFIGVPKEIKTDEYRVGLTPVTVKELTARGHRVAVETMAGAGAGIADHEYIAAGAEIVTSADHVKGEGSGLNVAKGRVSPDYPK